MQALTTKVREVLDGRSGRDGFARKAFREMEIFDAMENQVGMHDAFDETTGQKAERREHSSGEILTPKALAEVPDDLLATLKQAVIDLDPDQIQAVIDEIRKMNASIGQTMTDLANDFQYDKLLSLIQQRNV